MTQPATAIATIARQVKELRNARGWSGQRLAQAMTEQGIEWDRSIVANFENGRRRTITVDEWMTLAYVLGVAPVHLLMPIDSAGEFRVTPMTAVALDEARDWIRGNRALDDSSWFTRHRPAGDLGVDDVRDRLSAIEKQLADMLPGPPQMRASLGTLEEQARGGRIDEDEA